MNILFGKSNDFFRTCLVHDEKHRSTPFERLLFVCILLSLFLVVFFDTAMSYRPPMNIVTICLNCLAVLLIVIYLFTFGRLVTFYFPFLILAFNLLTFISWAINGFNDFSKSTILVSIVAIFPFLFMVQNKKNFYYGLLSITTGFLLYLFFFSFYYRTSLFLSPFSSRIGSYFGNINDVARALGYTFSLSLFWFFYKKYYFFIFPLLLSFYCILLTGSLSNISISFLVFLFLVFLKISKKKRWLFSLIVLLFLLVVFFLLKLPIFSYFSTRLTNIAEGLFGSSDGDGSASERLELLKNALLLFLDRPLFGGGFSFVSSNAIRETFSHDNFAELAANFGIIGLLIYQCLFFLPLKKATRTQNFSLPVLALLWVYIFFIQFFSVIYYCKIEYILFALMFSYFENLERGFI